MADPGDGDFAMFQPGKNGSTRLTVTRCEPAFQEEFLKKGARIKMFGGREVLERAREFPARRGGAFFFRSAHRRGQSYLRRG